MSHRPDPQLQTLYATARTSMANFKRISAHMIETPNAYDLAEDIMEQDFAALDRALTAPLDSFGWRRVNLSDGRYAEVFTIGTGMTTYALREANGTTIHCRTERFAFDALRAFSMAVYLDAHHSA